MLGVCAWLALRIALPLFPVSARFLIAWLVFTFGPGAFAGARLTSDLDPLRRTIVLLGLGSAAAPVLIDLLGRLHLLAAYPYVALALGGVGLSLWRPSGAWASNRPSRADLGACILLVILALGTGVVAFSHRLTTPPTGGILVNGAYDSVDLSFYAAWAAEASHTVPPTASYYSGHSLNAAYYPQLVLAMTHRFAAVPMLSIYFRYAWPVFLSLGALTAFVAVRALAPAGASLLAVVLVLVGGDFSYLAAWFLPHATVQWDYLLWPTNFLAPTMEVLHFNTWAPTLPVLFTALFAIVRGLQTEKRSWFVVGAAVLATLFPFKPFAYIVVMAGLTAAAVFSLEDLASCRRFAETLALTVPLTLPFVYSALGSPEDRRSRLLIDYFMLPQRMLIKLDLTEVFTSLANRLAPWTWLERPMFLLMATVPFLLVGPGIRWIGAPGVWRAIRGRGGSDAAAWRLLAWCVVSGVVIPFVLVTDPYVDTLQFYQTGLYVLWIFAGVALARFIRSHRTMGVVTAVIVVALALPSSVHFLAMKWTDGRRPPLVSLSASEVEIADFLRTTDPETTVVLHDRPVDPSLMSVVSDRRVVLAWSRQYYAVGSETRMRDVNAFYASATGDPDAAIDMLRRYRVTHVIVQKQRDRVHAGVLARLQPLLEFPDVALYGVPQG